MMLSLVLAVFLSLTNTCYDNDSSAIVYNGAWGTQAAAGAIGGEVAYTFEAGASACLTFAGSSVDFVTLTRSKRGHSYVFIDGQQVDYVDHYSPVLAWKVTFTYPVSYGQHTICVVAEGNNRIDLDAFCVQDDGGQQPTATATPTPTPVPTSGDVVLCIGDSITDNELVDPQDTYPAKLQAKLDRWHGVGSYTVLNYGQRGWFTDQIIAELPSWLAQTSPDYLLVMSGINDMRHGQTAEQVRAEIQQLVDIARAFDPAMRIVVSAVTPNVSDGKCDTVCMADLGSEMAIGLDGYDVLTHSNFFALLSNPYNLWGQADQWFFVDQLHPNASGNDVIAQSFYSALVSTW